MEEGKEGKKEELMDVRLEKDWRRNKVVGRRGEKIREADERMHGEKGERKANKRGWRKKDRENE